MQINAELTDLVMNWHKAAGGHGQKQVYHHALRAFREMIELCMAAGASSSEIWHVVDEEVGRQIGKHENKVATGAVLSEELADVITCLIVYEAYAGISARVGLLYKLPILIKREWAADEFGVLWRPGTEPTK